MYKMPKRLTRKRAESQRENDKRNGKARKIEGNINTSKRLTVPPEFFREQVTASTSHKSTSSNDSKERKANDYVLDNVHGLFNDCLNIRRSERLLKRSSNKSLNDNKGKIVGSNQSKVKKSSEDRCSTSKGNFNGIFNNCLNLNSYGTEILEPRKTKKILTAKFKKREEKTGRNSLRRSKSIFEEINELYTRSSQKSRSLNNSTDEPIANSKFSSSLFKQINQSYIFSQKTLLVAKSKIFSEIKKVDNILSGKLKMETEVPSTKREYYVDSEDNDSDINWKYFSKNEWVFQTPPAQIIHPPRIEENQLQPAIIYSSKKHTKIYELKPNAKVNLNNLENRKLPINLNFVNHLVTLNTTMDVDSGACSSAAFEQNTNSRLAEPCDKIFNFSQPQPKDRYVSVFSRPIKKLKVEGYRDLTHLKRKLDDDLSEDMFSSCKLTDTDQNRHVPVPSTSQFFQCNANSFGATHSNEFDQSVDLFGSHNGSDYCIMKNDPLQDTPPVAFNFKYVPSNGNKDTSHIFEFPNKY